MRKRLSAQDWIAFALSTLAREGFAALKADVLARKRGVSRGSFYWHFDDNEWTCVQQKTPYDCATSRMGAGHPGGSRPNGV